MPSPRLLFLCHTLPFPPDGGVWLRTYNVLRMLSERFDVTMLCFERAGASGLRNDSTRDAHVAALRPFARVEAFPLPQRHSRWRLLADHLRSLVRGRVFTFYRYESAPYRRRLRELLQAERFDLVHVDSLDLVGYLPELTGLPIVCVHHNVESQLLRRRATAERSQILRRYIAYQAALTEQAERTWCERVDLNVTVSEGDAAVLRGVVPKGRIAVVPNGVDIDYFVSESTADAGGGLVFVGGSDWFPNRDALEHFCNDILPLLGRNGRPPVVRWVGTSRPGDIESFQQRYQIELTGYVPDVRPLVQAADCFVVPLRVGGGSRLKILDAWSMGKAVVSTSVGCEGLHAADGENILVADTPAEFAAAVHRVLDDAKLRTSLGQAGRRTVEQRYSWRVLAGPMLRLYEGLLRSSAA